MLIKGVIHQVEITIVNTYASNISAPNFIQHTLLNLKAQINPNVMIVGNFNTDYHQ
jgi:hypothetical protein